MFDPGEPLTRDELSASLAAMTRAGADALATLSLPVFFAPQGAKWSPAEHVRHLRKSSAPVVLALRLPVWALRLRFGRPVRPSRNFATLRRDYRTLLDAGGQAGTFAPRPEGPPADPERRRREIVQQWTAVNARLSSLLSGWSDARLDQAQVPHPLLGPLTMREVVAFTVYHTVHHLQIVMDRAAAGAHGSVPAEAACATTRASAVE